MAKTATRKTSRTMLRKRSDGRTLQQYAALPYIRDASGQIEVLVMSSRETRRAVIPKGWPMKNRKGWKAAEIEARQEAGIVGAVDRRRVGQYRYWKRLERSFALVKVSVYPLKVTRHLTEWPEKHERTLLWLSPEDAATLVDEPELGDLIRGFPDVLDQGSKKAKKAVKKKSAAKLPGKPPREKGGPKKSGAKSGAKKGAKPASSGSELAKTDPKGSSGQAAVTEPFAA